MTLQVRVIFTGICSILRDYDRVLLPYANRPRAACDGVAIPVHHAYIRYRIDQNKLPTPPDDMSQDRRLAAVFLNGDEIVIKGHNVTPSIRPTHPIGHVASMEQIYPGLQLDDAALKKPLELSHALVAAYFPLDMGSFVPPNPDDSKKWHFFPPKGSPIQGTLAQQVTYEIQLDENYLLIALRPFGDQKETDVLWLEPKDSNEVTIIIGNTQRQDIFPTDLTQGPMLGPDRHFENYYRLAKTASCPLPIPYYEGDGTEMGNGGGHQHPATQASTLPEVIRFAAEGGDSGGFDSIGGANCPPNQWP